MATQPCPNIAQAQLQFYSDNELIEHSLYFEKDTGWTSGSITALAAEVGTQWATTVMPDYPEEVALYRCIATDLTSLEGSRAVYELPVPAAGSIIGGPTPNNVCFAMQLGTGSRGRGKQGRLFIGPLARADVTADKWLEARAEATATDIQSVATAVEAALPGANWVVLSRYSGGVKRANGIGLPVLSVGYSNLLTDSQKDRLPQHKKRKKRTP